MFSVCIAYVAVGCTWAWTSPVLPRLMDENSWLKITEEEGSWIGSFLAIGGVIGPLLSSRLLDKVGRKWTLVTNAFFLLFGWFTLYISSHLYIIYFGRFLCGIALGSTYMAVPTYLAEVADVSMLKVFFFASKYVIDITSFVSDMLNRQCILTSTLSCGILRAAIHFMWLDCSV